MAKAVMNHTGMQFDRIAAMFAALVILGLVGFLLIRGKEIPGPGLFYALRVVLSFATAALGATIPGFLNVSWKGGGLAVRSGGALALYVLTFFCTPDLGRAAITNPGDNSTIAQAAPNRIISAPGGLAAGTITGGTFNLTSPGTVRQIGDRYLEGTDEEWIFIAPAGAVIEAVGLNCSAHVVAGGHSFDIVDNHKAPVRGFDGEQVHVSIRLEGSPASAPGVAGSPGVCQGKFLVSAAGDGTIIDVNQSWRPVVKH
jgi:hypothetical protein